MSSTPEHTPSAEEIRAFREGRGQSGRAFADAVGVDQSTVVSWEQGRTRPRGIQLHALRRVMGRGIPSHDARESATAPYLATPRAIRAEDADGVLLAVAAMNRTLAELIEAAQDARAVERQAVLALAPPVATETRPPESAERPASARTGRRRAKG